MAGDGAPIQAPSGGMGRPKFLRDFWARPGLSLHCGKENAAQFPMKTNLTLLVGLLALGFCVPATAQDKDKPKKQRTPPSKESILKKWDKDKDGALSKDELAAMPERMKANLLKRGDKDNNGELSKEEVDGLKFGRRDGAKGKGKGDGAKKKDQDKDKDKDKDGGGE